LAFDPFDGGAHRCPRCGRSHEGPEHDRWRIVWVQLWLAERAVHAALLALVDEGSPERARRAAFADRLLDEWADLYLRYPNADNVLGPTRPFFSTYLESIWTLYLAIALDLREAAGDCALGPRVRERVLAPSAALIASYDEGDSNRQVWNNAALFAAGRLLGDGALQQRAVTGRSGLVRHLEHGLLPDGTWPEGENYHLFAHRGLWYGVTLAETAGFELPAKLGARFEDAFVAPFLSRLPDFSFPSRRDSQYGISLRQWRIAEMAELGLARLAEGSRAAALRGALHELYRDDVPPGDTGRWRSTAESEINAPAARLDRSSLGWRSLFLAREHLPELAPVPLGSVLFPAQGYAVLRREAGSVYLALDYGLTGGGHGHPDRLNVVFCDGGLRWLDDYGTGAYVDPSLHWYRSTLAHNAPLVAGRSQTPRDGRLLAFEERGAAGWVDAEVEGVAPGVRFRRTLVAMPTYFVDVLEWSAPDDVRVELPVHALGELAVAGEWRPANPEGGAGEEDGFDFLRDVVTAGTSRVARFRGVGRDDGEELRRLDAWIDAGEGATWWRATAPAKPVDPVWRPFHFVRVKAERGSIASVWSWHGDVVDVRREDDGRIAVALADGGRHEHARSGSSWHVDLTHGAARSSIDLGDATRATEAPAERELRTVPEREEVIPLFVASEVGRDGPGFRLGARHYRRSEPTWEEAGRPSADVTLLADEGRLVIDVEVHKAEPPTFVAPGTANPLDNDPAATRGDGLHVFLSPGRAAPERERTASWLLVPRTGSDAVDLHVPRGFRRDVPIDATWRRTADGYAVRATVALAALGLRAGDTFRFDLVVNETSPGRERRRGQLVLSGGAGEFVYIRSDGHDLARLLPFKLSE
ncbi:MAG: heparinase II/III family protein, partial [Gemmatimonadaceae bacterium]